MLIFQGDADILGPDTIEFARKAARAGVDVRLRVEPGGFHVYVLSVPFIPEAVAALDRSARFVTGILRSRRGRVFHERSTASSVGGTRPWKRRGTLR